MTTANKPVIVEVNIMEADGCIVTNKWVHRKVIGWHRENPIVADLKDKEKKHICHFDEWRPVI